MSIQLFYHLIQSFFVAILMLAPSHCSLTSPASNSTDREALLSFKALISSDPLGVLSSWNETNTTLHFCNWLGVTCGNTHHHPERVVALDLPSLNLTGSLSPALGNLTFLRTLRLSTNKLEGHIPPNLGRLSRLEYLDLSQNFLQGEVPALIHCTKLRNIFLQNNNLTGQIPSNLSHFVDLNVVCLNYNQLTGLIPASLGSLSKLHILGLYHNRLAGSIPPSLGNLSSLIYLDLWQNGLEGRIPDSLGRLTSLLLLNLNSNSLSGNIPPFLFNISSIRKLELGANYLSGMLPTDMGNTLPHVEWLMIYYNQLVGNVPTSLTNASRLQITSFHGNRFVGKIPPNLGSLSELTEVDFGLNSMEAREARDWDFIISLSNCSNLQILHLAINDLQGVLPNSIGNLSTQLTWLSVEGNRISGTIPVEIGRYINLTDFKMGENLLTGIIPSSIGMLQNLHYLYLSGNKFHGEIPSSLGNLTQLNALLLQDNRLEGSIPISFGRLSNLIGLNLSCNRLTGVIPGEVLGISSLSEYLDLSHNLLEGPLPSKVGELINLNVLDASDNRLTGEIPSSLGACQVLGRLYMEGNMFQGHIPSSFSALAGLEELDLSSNNLSGSIPEFLETFRSLHYLNLSFNDLEGQVPTGGAFGNASAISILGNSKLCGGNQNMHLQPCIQGVVSFGSSWVANVIILVVFGILLFILLPTICTAYRCIRRRRKMRFSATTPTLKDTFLQLSYKEIQRTTDGFSMANLIGAGSFGSVYKGIIVDNSGSDHVVAIKVFKLERRGAMESFVSECDSLRAIRHKNLINIVTVCSSVDDKGNDFRALVFDYMPKGSLDDWLHPRVDEECEERRLSLVQRWKVIMDVAFALEYLHLHCHTPIVHCDLKPSNVLLDDDMTARICDFGLARVRHENITNNATLDPNGSSAMLGSIGYIAPEYGMGGAFTTQGDVYSFGVLVLETFTGKRPTNEIFQGSLNLHKYVAVAYPDGIMDIVDPSLLLQPERESDNGQDASNIKDKIYDFMVLILKLGLSCSKESPEERREIGDVLNDLFLIEKLLHGLN